ncbi:MAG: TRAP transporter small permease [Saprospiraceae bacterium]|nr:TRAP transporter small permease [Saprospiraceae bacterium]
MREKLDKVLEWILIVLMSAMTLDVLWGVFTRYIVGSQAPWSEELARYLLIWIGILGAAWASGKHLHLAIDLFPESLTPMKKRRLMVIINLLVIFFVIAAMIIGGLRLVYVVTYLGQESAALKLPLGAVYTVMPLSGIIIVYHKVLDIMNELNSEQPAGTEKVN